MAIPINVRNIILCLFILSLLLSPTLSLTLNLNSLLSEKCLPGQKSCHVELAGNTTYEITHRVVMTNLEAVSLLGHPNTVIACSSHYTNLENRSVMHFENVKSVILERIRIEDCFPSEKITPRHDWSIISIINCPMSRIVGLVVNNFRSNVIFYLDVPSVQIINSSFSNGIDGRAVFFEATSATSSVRFEAYNSNFYKIRTPVGIENFFDLHAYGGGAGILIQLQGRVTSYFNISASNFTSCTSLLSPAIYIFEYNSGVNHFFIEKSRFVRNQQNETFEFIGGAVGALFLSSKSYISIVGCLFQSNKGFKGGALSIIHTMHEQGVFLTIEESYFSQNMAKDGGAIFLNGLFNPFNFYELNLACNIFENNSAEQSGGAIFAIQYVINLEGGTFLNNNASYGGAIASLDSIIRYSLDPSENVTLFTGNYAKFQGGAIFTTSSSSLRSIKPFSTYGTEGRIDIVNNSAGINGGGVYDDNIFVGYHLVEEQRSLFETQMVYLNIKHNEVSLAAKYPEVCFGNNIYQSIPNSPISSHGSCGFSSGSVNFTTSFKNVSRDNLIILTNEDIGEEILDHISQEVTKFLGENKGDSTYVFVPGLTTRLNLSAYDILGNKVYANLIFTLELDHGSHQKICKNKFDEDYNRDGKYFFQQSFHSGTEIKLNFSVPNLCKRSSQSTWRINACIRIVAQSNLLIQGKTKQCFDAIFTKCLPGYTFRNGACQLLFHSHKLTYIGKPKYYLNNVPGKLVRQDKNHISFVRCPWFHCRCQRTSSKEKCYFNPLKPSDQCIEGLTGNFCTQCPHDETPYPPFSIISIFSPKPCFTCHLPILMIIIYFLITLFITIFILLLKVDIFADYVRTITFYSSSLYIISLTIGFSENSIKYILYIPIIVMNLLISSLYPFCLPQGNSANSKLFEAAVPFIFVVYILIFVLLVKYTSLSTRFGRYIRDIIYPIWAIIILTYSHICNQAFVLFNCMELETKKYVWFYDPNVSCFQMTPQRYLAYPILYLLVTFPLILYIFSYMRANHNIRHFVEIYDKRYKSKFRNWEIFKLFLRFAIGGLLSMHSNYHPHLHPLLTSLIFLIMMSLTALLQPAENRLTNHFEAFCFLILALLTLPSLSFSTSFFLLLDILAFVPYALITIRFGYLLMLRARAWKLRRRKPISAK